MASAIGKRTGRTREGRRRNDGRRASGKLHGIGKAIGRDWMSDRGEMAK